MKGNSVKKFLILTFSILLSAQIAFAQDTSSGALRQREKTNWTQVGMLAVSGGYMVYKGGICASHSNPCAAVWFGMAAMTFASALDRKETANSIPNDYRPIETNPNPGCEATGTCFTNNDIPDPETPDGGGGNGNRPGNGRNGNDGVDRVKDLANEDLAKLKNDLISNGIDANDPKAIQKAIDKGKAAEASSGLSANDLMDAKAKAEASKLVEKALARYGVSGVDLEDGGGGGSRGRGGREVANSNGGFPDFAALMKKPEEAAPGIDGLSKDFNGNPIGLAQGDIFKQVHDRYVTKQKGGTFLNEVVGPRVPSSAMPYKKLKFK